MYGTTATNTYTWYAGAVVEFIYDGTSYIMQNATIATTTYYGITKLSSSTSSTSTSLAATASAVKAAYDLAEANAYTHPSVTTSNTTSTASPSHSGTVTMIDSVTKDSGGHVTGVNTKTVTLPSSPSTAYCGIDSNTHSGVIYDGKVVFISFNGNTPSGAVSVIKAVGKYPLKTTTFPVIVSYSSKFYLGFIYLGSSSSTVSVRICTNIESGSSTTTLDSDSTGTVYGCISFVCK